MTVFSNLQYQVGWLANETMLKSTDQQQWTVLNTDGWSSVSNIEQFYPHLYNGWVKDTTEYPGSFSQYQNCYLRMQVTPIFMIWRKTGGTFSSTCHPADNPNITSYPLILQMGFGDPSWSGNCPTNNLGRMYLSTTPMRSCTDASPLPCSQGYFYSVMSWISGQEPWSTSGAIYSTIRYRHDEWVDEEQQICDPDDYEPPSFVMYPHFSFITYSLVSNTECL